jgi:serine/threonine protein phosphatase 1
MSLTYAVGDIHGSLDKLQTLMARCNAHAAGREQTFVFLGDYIDRGADSSGVISFLIDLQAGLPARAIALMGNHEAMALAVIDGLCDAGLWLPQGGAETLHSYGVDRACDLPRAHVDWMRSLPLRHDDGRRFFVHAGIRPGKPLAAQSEEDLLWIREPFLSDRRDHGRLIVHGHTPTTSGSPDRRQNRLGLDTGAVYGGPLTAAAFADSQTEPIAILQAE